MFHQTRILKLFIREATNWYPPIAASLFGGGATSLYFTFVASSKWTATFPYPKKEQSLLPEGPIDHSRVGRGPVLKTLAGGRVQGPNFALRK